jgi:hypothetical protein
MDRPRRFSVLWIFLIALLLRLLLVQYFNFALDDAYITFRVARNIASGYGMVFNPGEQVLSITTPLYALLMVPGEVLGIGAVFWSKIMNSILAAATCSLIYLLLRSRVNRGILFIAVTWMIVNPISIFITLTGMESPLVFFLVILAVLLYRREMFGILGLVLGLCCLVRPEGCIAAILFWVSVLAFKRKGLLWVTVPLAVISLAWFVYSTRLFGSVIPNSYFAKQAYFSVHPGTSLSNISSYIRFFMPTIPLAIVAPVLFVVGAWSALTHFREFLPLSAWLLVVFFLQLTSNFYIAFWYMHMLLPAIILIVFLGLQKLLNVLPEPLKSVASSRAAAVTFGLILLIFMSFFSLQWRSEINDMRISDERMGRIGEWFVLNDVPTDRIVGLEAIGRVGYESDLRVLDRMGLVSPEVIPYIRSLRDDDVNIIRIFHPDYYVTGFVLTEEQVPGYRAVAVFPNEMVSRANEVDAIMRSNTYIYAYEE